MQPSTQHVTHVYNTADPIPMGTCTGVSSTCGITGIAIETRCHLGQVIRYDTVTKLGWSANVIHHGIQALIDGVLSRDDIDWGDSVGKNQTVPALTTEEDCVVGVASLRQLGWCSVVLTYYRTASTGNSAIIATLPGRDAPIA